MAGLNQCNFIGRLGRDPETKYTQSGKAVCSFYIAVDTGYGDKKSTEWVSVVCWEKTAEAVQKFCSKGSQVFVSGRLQTRTWEKDGAKQYKTEVVANDVIFLSTAKPGADYDGRTTEYAKGASKQARQEQAQAPPGADNAPDDDMEIPF